MPFLYNFTCHYKWQTRCLSEFPNACLKAFSFAYQLVTLRGWDSVKAPFFSLTYFKMQLSGFNLADKCSRVLSLSSDIYHQPAEEMRLLSSQHDKTIFLNHNTSPVSHTIMVNSLSAQHPMQFFREYDSIWKEVQPSGTHFSPVPNFQFLINTRWPSRRWHTSQLPNKHRLPRCSEHCQEVLGIGPSCYGQANGLGSLLNLKLGQISVPGMPWEKRREWERKERKERESKREEEKVGEIGWAPA